MTSLHDRRCVPDLSCPHPQSYHNAVAEIALRQARKIDAPSGPSDPFENRKRKGGGGAVDLQGKTKPKRFLARLRGELRDSASSRDRSSMVQSAAGGNRPAKGGEITAVASKAAAAVGKASVNPLQLKGALQKARAEQTDAGDDVPATRPKTGKRRVGFGSVGGSNRAMFMLEEDTASGGLFGIGTWGQSAKVEQKPVPVGLAQVQLPVAQGSR